jgi:integrase
VTRLAVRAFATGTRKWIYQYRDRAGRIQRISIGNVGSIDIDDARTTARRLAGNTVAGKDPAAERAYLRGATSVKDLVDRYLKHCDIALRPSTLDQVKRNFLKYSVPLHSIPVNDLKREDVHKLVTKLKDSAGPIQVNRVRSSIATMLNWGLKSGTVKINTNPAAFVPKAAPEKPRNRVLTNAEIKAIWATTEDGSDYGRIIRVLLLSGCRRGEIGGLRWSEIGSDEIVIPGERMKAGRSHLVPLLPLIAAQLPARGPGDSVFGDNGQGFKGWSQSLRRLQRRSKTDDWTPHDLRRVIATRLNDAGVNYRIVETLLAHSIQSTYRYYVCRHC